jgi:hypothetical protein
LEFRRDHHAAGGHPAGALLDLGHMLDDGGVDLLERLGLTVVPVFGGTTEGQVRLIGET